MVKKPLVQMVRKGDKIPFDVAATRVLFIRDPDLDTVEDTKSQLVAHIIAAKEDASQVDNPISISIDLQALRQSSDPQQKQLAEIAGVLESGFASLRADIAEVRKSGEHLPSCVALSSRTLTIPFPDSIEFVTRDPKLGKALDALAARYNVQSASEDIKPLSDTQKPSSKKKK